MEDLRKRAAERYRAHKFMFGTYSVLVISSPFLLIHPFRPFYGLAYILPISIIGGYKAGLHMDYALQYKNSIMHHTEWSKNLNKIMDDIDAFAPFTVW